MQIKRMQRTLSGYQKIMNSNRSTFSLRKIWLIAMARTYFSSFQYSCYRMKNLSLFFPVFHHTSASCLRISWWETFLVLLKLTCGISYKDAMDNFYTATERMGYEGCTRAASPVLHIVVATALVQRLSEKKRIDVLSELSSRENLECKLIYCLGH